MQGSMHHNYHSILKKRFGNELFELNLSVLFRTFAISLVGLFVPIYLYHELGLGLKGVLTYYLIWSIFLNFLTPIYAKIAYTFGYKKMFLLSVPFYLSHIYFLYYLESNISLYWIPAILAGISGGFYSLSLDSDFAKFSDKKNRSSQVSKWYSLALAGSVVGPLISGIILVGSVTIPWIGDIVLPFSGFNVIFVLVSIFMILSAVPMFFTKDYYYKVKFSLKYIFKKEHLKDFIGFICLGLEYNTSLIFYPLFIFLIVKSYISLGAIATIVGIFVVFFTLIIGKLSDKYDRSLFIKIATWIHNIIYVARYWIRSFFGITIVGIASNLAYIGYDVPLSAIIYDKINKTNRIEYLIMKELGIGIGRVLIIWIGALAIWFVSEEFSYLATFAVSGLTGFGHFLFL